MSRPSRRARRQVSRRTLILGGLVFVVVVLVVPMILAALQARAAKADLEAVKSALADGDPAAAEKSIDRATSRAARAEWLMNSPVGDVWSVVPVIGGAVDDVRHLTSALDSTAKAADVAVQLYPEVSGDDATLMKNGSVDPATLQVLVKGAQQAGGELESADSSLEQVQGDTPQIGGTIRGSRDGAYDQIHPLADAYRKAAPIIPQLPKIFGIDGPQRYLIAMLNPAELRYSGGAALSLAGMDVDRGQLRLGESLDLEDSVNPYKKYTWKRVAHNPFHTRGEAMPLRNATFAPSWSVSGPELLRAVQKGFHQTYDGLITVDVVAMADLLRVTGPLEVTGYGTLTADNLVTTLVGSYDKYPDPTQRHALNQAIIPAFKDRLLGGGSLSDRVKSLTTSARGGHFAMFMRDPTVEDSLQSLDLAGDLSDTNGDYVGVFTQNLNGSKVDVLQHRSLGYDVILEPDGSARATLRVKIANPTPPYAPVGTDPGNGYFTRYAGVSIGAFLADGAELKSAALPGTPPTSRLRDFYGRPWVSRSTTISPGGDVLMTVKYHIPHAATVNGDQLAYRLTFQPQGTATASNLVATVHLPAGFEIESVPAGWTVSGRTATLAPSNQPVLTTWDLAARRTP